MATPGKPPSNDSSPRQQAEALLLSKASASPEAIELRSLEATPGRVHELQVHQLELQKEELRRTQQELEASRAHYFALCDLAPVG